MVVKEIKPSKALQELRDIRAARSKRHEEEAARLEKSESQRTTKKRSDPIDDSGIRAMDDSKIDTLIEADKAPSQG